MVNGEPSDRKRPGIAKVKRPEDTPTVFHSEVVDDMGPSAVVIMRRVISPFREYLPNKGIPVSLKPCLTPCLREIFELVEIFRVCLHQCAVVIDKRLDEGILLRLFIAYVRLVYEKPLDIGVAFSSRVAGVVSPQGIVCSR